MVQRIFSVALAALLSLLILHPAMAQDQANPRRVGVLTASSLSDPATKRSWDALVNGLRERGWEEGRNLALEGRFAGSDVARFNELAGELVALKVDVIVTGNTPSTDAARRKTTTIPIVMLNITDPVGLGLVASLTHPGGNITGLANQMEIVAGKHFDLLKALKPGIERVGIMFNPDNPGSVLPLKYTQEQLVPRLGLVVVPIAVSKPADFDQAFALIARERLDALVVYPSAPMWPHRAKIAAFAIEQRLPAVTALAVLARDGMLMSYGWDIAASWRRSAAYVDLILKGANPAELPVELADRFELVVNLKTARELGLTIPPSILLRADEVIE